MVPEQKAAPPQKAMSHIGLAAQPWLPMSIEMEFCSSDKAITEALTSNESSLSALPDHMRLVIEESSQVVHRILNSSALPVGSKQAGMRILSIKKGHDVYETSQLSTWIYEREGQEGKLELSSPIDLSENEVEFAFNVWSDSNFKHAFLQKGGCHMHVDARCLLGNDQRLVALLLMWERFHDAMKSRMHIQNKGKSAYAAKLADKNPELLRYLQMRLMHPDGHQEPLKEAFKRFENLTTIGKEQSWDKAPDPERDGYRNCALNVCHLIDVDCCKDCPKNLVPKFGGLEFRMFFSTFDHERARHYAAVAQRLVQTACSVPLESMKRMALLPGVQQASNADELLDFLQFDKAEFEAAFLK